MNHNKNGFTEAAINAVWKKGSIVPGQNPNIIIRDVCGALIKRAQYGNVKSKYGWEIDHIRPVSKRGNRFLINLQPLQWENNRHKGDNYPNWSCKVRA